MSKDIIPQKFHIEQRFKLWDVAPGNQHNKTNGTDILIIFDNEESFHSECFSTGNKN